MNIFGYTIRKTKDLKAQDKLVSDMLHDLEHTKQFKDLKKKYLK